MTRSQKRKIKVLQKECKLCTSLAHLFSDSLNILHTNINELTTSSILATPSSVMGILLEDIAHAQTMLTLFQTDLISITIGIKKIKPTP